jgi:hypothetical protein
VEVEPQEYLLIGFSEDTFQGRKKSEKRERVIATKKIISNPDSF